MIPTSLPAQRWARSWPGPSSSVRHLRENVAGAGLTIPEDELAELDGIAV